MSVPIHMVNAELMLDARIGIEQEYFADGMVEDSSQRSPASQ